MLFKRLVGTEVPVVVVSLILVAGCNSAFWQHLYSAVSPQNAYEYFFLGGIGILTLSMVSLLLGAVAFPYVLKPVATLLLLSAAGASYFSSEYGTIIDGDMLRNVLQTNRAEVADLLTPKLAAYVLCLGILPSAVLWAWPITYRPLRQKIVYKSWAVVALGAVVFLTSSIFSQNIMSVFRQHRLLLDLFAPFNIISASGELARKYNRPAKTATVAAYGRDAHKSQAWARRQRKSVTVIVVGETARSDKFSLNGYSRQTNPLLGGIADLISYTQAYSCGTNTSHSLPCMFSGYGASGFRVELAARREGLLDIIKGAGFSVLWRENQAGCYGVCKRVPTEVLEHAGSRTFFELGESLDENLLEGLQERIDAMQGDTVIVLHMMGSHGPAYYKRYPPAFERFQPSCKESQFSRCALTSIVNSYDNTLLYSDYVLAHLIELLQANDRKGRAAAMIYLSDHGESLGEGNIYLHGMPNVVAPAAQKHIPLLVWLSPNYRTEAGVDLACLEQRRHEPISHDNFFHSVLGLLDVATRVYERDFDLFAPCRRKAQLGASPEQKRQIN